MDYYSSDSAGRVFHFLKKICSTMLNSLFQRNINSPSTPGGNSQTAKNLSSHSGHASLEMEIEEYDEEKVDLVANRDPAETPAMSEPPQDEEERIKPPATTSSTSTLSRTGLQVLILLAVQNCSKNLLLRYVMKDRPDFLTSAAVLGCEATKLTLSVLYILLIDRRSLGSIYQFLKDDYRNMILLSVPAAAYNFQMSLEYVALANLNAAVFSVLVQTKLLATATFAAVILRTKLRVVQIISLVLLTVGVMLINIDNMKGEETQNVAMKGIMATLGRSSYTHTHHISCCSRLTMKNNYSLCPPPLMHSVNQESPYPLGLHPSTRKR